MADRGARGESRPGTVEHLLRELAPQVLGVLARKYGDFSAAEDAVQEALVAAARQWPREGLPDKPRAWLVRVAARRLVDDVRSGAARKKREESVVSLVPADEQWALGAEEALSEAAEDDSLRLLFLCCHGALTTASAIALTLRAVAGLTTAEIASAYLVPEATMAQRISRAKARIRDAGAAFELPEGELFRSRLAAVSHVLYLLFNEGYVASAGDRLLRTDLSDEALRLARLLHRLVPEEPEVSGLLALLLLTDARREARTGAAGEMIPLDEQDRSLWDRRQIEEGLGLLEAALGKGAAGPYQLQAAVAAVHCRAPSAAETDWDLILTLYTLLDQLAPSPVVQLSLAVAVAMVHGPEAGLERLALLEADERLRSSHRLHAVRAHLLERAGDRQRAILEYREAATRTHSLQERDYLLLKAARLAGKGSAEG